MANDFSVSYKRRSNPNWDALAHWRVKDFASIDRAWAEQAHLVRVFDLLTNMRRSLACKFSPIGKIAAALSDYERSLSKEEEKRCSIQIFGDRRGVVLLQNPELQGDFFERHGTGLSLRENLALTIASSQASVIMVINENQKEGAKNPALTIEIFVLSNRDNASLVGDLKQFFKLNTQELTPVPDSRILFLMSEGMQIEVIPAESGTHAGRVSLLKEHGLGARRGIVLVGQENVESRQVPLVECDPLALLGMLETAEALAIRRRLNAKKDGELSFLADAELNNSHVLTRIRKMLDPEGVADLFYLAIQQGIQGLPALTNLVMKSDLGGSLENTILGVGASEEAPRIFTSFVRKQLEAVSRDPVARELLRTFGPEPGGFGFWTA